MVISLGLGALPRLTGVAVASRGRRKAASLECMVAEFVQVNGTSRGA